MNSFLRNRILWIILFCQVVFFSTAQQKKGKAKQSFDTSYVKSFRSRLHFSVFLATKGSNVTLYNVQDNKESVKYSPNNYLNFGLGINYKFIALETSFKFPFLSTTDPKKGNSSVANIRLNLIRKKYWVTGIIQNVKGFYLANPESIDPNWFKYNTNYPLRPDITQSLFYLTGNYIFNHTRFSYRSTVNAYEHQVKSAGSFVAGFTIASYGASAESSLSPEVLSSKFSIESDVLKSRIMHVGGNAGYLHTFAIRKKFFIHLGAVGSVGIKKARTTFAHNNETIFEKSLGAIFDSKMAVGYNGTRNFFSVNFNALTLPDNAKKRVEFDYQFLRLIYSRRM